MTEEIKKLIELRINAGVIENRSNYALFNEGMRKGSEIAKEIILSKWQEAERWRKVGEELPEVKRGPYHIIARSKLGYQIITICNYGAGVSDQMEYFGVTEWKPIS